MNTQTLESAIEDVYQSLDNGNKDIDLYIGNLKTALETAGEKEAQIDAERLAQNNRSGRKMMQSYFKKRGVKVVFKS